MARCSLVLGVQNEKYPNAPIYGGSDKIPKLTHLLKDKDEFVVGENIRVR